MTAPLIENHFDAVRVTTATTADLLNRARLVAAIELLKTRGLDGAVREFADRYPAAGSHERHRYFEIASLCIVHNLKP